MNTDTPKASCDALRRLFRAEAVTLLKAARLILEGR